jgi:peptidoglycan/LPS O-acetylase OafA/YrhL
VTDLKEESRERYHDLDALRALAMLLGIALHGALSFVPFPWSVQDSEQHAAFGTFFFAVHGFRMPVFFVMSGFFTAMLWRRRGLAVTLKQRFMRVFLPCMVGLFAIVPLNHMAGEFVYPKGDPAEIGFDLIGLARRGDLAGVEALLASGVDANGQAQDQSSALHWAAVSGHRDIVRALLGAGAEVNIQSADGGTPLHWTAFLGEPEMVELLLEAGADPKLANHKGETPLDTVLHPWDEGIAGITEFFAGIMQLDVDLEEIEADRPAIITALGGSAVHEVGGAGEGMDDAAIGKWIEGLFVQDVFGHLWFLWFLCWLVAAFSVYALFATVIDLKSLPSWLIVSPLRFAWLLPLTLLPQLMMRFSGEMPGFGPDTSTGWLPFPHLLFYYAIFFFFGAFYHDAKDAGDRFGSWWWVSLPLALFVVFPLGMELSMKPTWSLDMFPEDLHHLCGSALEVLYTWLMVFGLMGLFSKLFGRERRWMRYISDSSYWLYLAHLPLIMIAQWFVKDWELSPFLKFPLVCAAVTLVLLLSYQLFVRYTPIGTFLNGRRRRPA